MSNGTGFGAGTKWSDWFCVGNEECRTGDMNGSGGKADVIAFVRSTQGEPGAGDVWVSTSQ